MMKSTKLRQTLLQLLRSPKNFPVELFIGIVFFAMSVCMNEHCTWTLFGHTFEWDKHSDIIPWFIPLFALTYWLGKVNRWASYASALLFLPLLLLNWDDYFNAEAVGMTYVVAAILLIIGTRKLSNQTFCKYTLHVVTQLFYGVLITGLLFVAVMLIVASFLYIFGIDKWDNLILYIFMFIWLVLAPQICCTFMSQKESEESSPNKVVSIIINYILSPAIIIYTLILYVYFIKIAIEWDLPKGGVAWMVTAFITAALMGRLAQYALSQHHFDWFYNHFTWIAIPPLVMYWVGSIYRISAYGFTSSRIYLLLAGVLMTLFVLMLLWKRSRQFQLMAVILACTICVFTFVPGISAKDLGLSSQKARLEQYISELNLRDGTTGKLVNNLKLDTISSDSLLCEKYKEVCDVISYLRGENKERFVSQYGEWEYNVWDFSHRYDVSLSLPYGFESPIDLGDYPILIPKYYYHTDYNRKTGIITVSHKGDATEDDEATEDTVIIYPVKEIISQKPELLDSPEQLLVYSNDSLKLVLPDIYLNKKTKEFDFAEIEWNSLVFRKKK